MLQAVNSHCFEAFLAIEPDQFKLVLDAIIWAFKHTMRNVADTGSYLTQTCAQQCGRYRFAPNPNARSALWLVQVRTKPRRWFSNVADTGSCQSRLLISHRLIPVSAALLALIMQEFCCVHDTTVMTSYFWCVEIFQRNPRFTSRNGYSNYWSPMSISACVYV